MNINNINNNKKISLHEAAYNGDIEQLKLLLFKKGKDINSKLQKDFTTPLHHAILKDQLECVKFLLENGADLEAKDKEGLTAIQYASFNGNLQIMKILINSGANILTVDKDGSTPQHKAAYQGHLECLEILLSNANIINPMDDFGCTPLHLASMQGHIECIKLLLKKGALVDCEEKDGSTPLIKSTISGYLECVQILLEYGAHVNKIDKMGASALHYACEYGYNDIAKLLIEKNALLNIFDFANITPLHNACFHGYLSCVLLLCDCGAVVNVKDGITSPLHQAAFNGHDQIITLLLKKGAHINARDEEGATPIMKASFNGHLNCIQILVSHGAYINIKDKDGSSPLHAASFSGHHQCIKYLIENQMDVNCKDNENSTPLHQTALNGHIECLKVLVEAKANVNEVDYQGNTPLHMAAKRGNKKCASYLIKHGAFIDIQNKKGMTPLHFSVKHSSCVLLLLKSGAQVDIKDDLGRTPLFYAVKINSEESVRILIFKGANINIIDKKGHSLLKTSKILTKTVLMQILKEKNEYEQSQAYKEYEKAVKKFNRNPNLGINYLIESKIIDGSPESISKFLYTAEGIDKNVLGAYISKKENIEICKAFINRMDFSHFEFDHALRYFLTKFRLSGEAQKIDRIVEIFANKFTKDNPSVFSHSDTAYFLAFSIIMLNTDAHNPNIKKEKKITLEQWIKNTKNITGPEIPSEFLEKIYYRIVQNEIKMETDINSNYINAEKKGYLMKQGGRIKTWKKRWFVLSGNCIYYFKNNESTEPLGILPLENLAVRRIKSVKKRFSFEIYQPEQDTEMKACKFDSKGTPIKANHESYIISCESEQELEEWMKAIESNIFKNPFVDLIWKKLAKTKHHGTMRSFQNYKESLRVKNLSELKINFKVLYELATMCFMLIYKTPSDLIEKYGPTTILETIGEKYMYFITINHDSKKQYIVLGTKLWLNITLLKKDFLLWQQNEKKIDPFVYYKLLGVANQITEFIESHFKKDYNTIITGYSIFCIISIELANLLEKKGFKIQKIVTFGQPKIEIQNNNFNNNLLQEKYPFFRVIDIRDPVSILFPGFIYSGTQIILLSDKYHTNIENNEIPESEFLNLDELLLNESLHFHNIQFYLQRIQPKIKNSILISYLEKDKYK